ncbi:type IV pilin-like G/H family protein [Cyanobacterium aponinum UTEX 3222]|uniref:type IV pilin-like G/H family protein n=1 Tax=Cyanobacterium aponinum TaxID=379064 RepID=UPI003091D09B|nr:type IV pilin-like G/H family protein [Cyanobacterium aponinum UTEX 3222]
MNLFLKLIFYSPPHQKKLNCEGGFTLIELIIVMVMLGILSAIAIPSFMNQIGKARESETKNYLGLIARGQQAYHWEKKTFANNLASLGVDEGGSKYHSIAIVNPATVDDVMVEHQAIALNAEKDQVRNFAIGVYFSGGFYSISLCQSIDINDPVNVGDTASDNCTNNGIKLK